MSDTKFELPEVAFVSGFGYIVRSASHPDMYRLVYNDTCTCPAAAHGARTCRHRRAVDEFVRSHAADYKRPRAQENVEFFV